MMTAVETLTSLKNDSRLGILSDSRLCGSADPRYLPAAPAAIAADALVCAYPKSSEPITLRMNGAMTTGWSVQYVAVTIDPTATTSSCEAFLETSTSTATTTT